MSRVVTVEEAQSHLRELLEQVRTGQDDVVIAENGTPVARLSSVPNVSGERRVPGCDEGRIQMAPDFEGPLPDDVIESFYQ